MRYVVVFVAGIATGYTLHIKKDQTIETVANGVVRTVDKATGGLRSRISVS